MAYGRRQTTGGGDGNRHFLLDRVPFAVYIAALVFFMFNPATCRASEGGTELGMMKLEDLMEIEISSASRKAESLSDAATAIFVITPEDIRRSGATCIPELLRMVPGIEVARIDANSWAITSRGFNGLFADKLLVLMDGRSVYTPLFGGVYWDVQDTLLEDIERIEVIRGPGATLWGANAVNGVINIITRNSRDTIGGLVSAGAGSEERGFGALRYGTKIGSSGFLRVYGKYLNRDDSILSSGERSSDGWDSLRGGFRFDVLPTDRDALTIQGDIYGGKEGGSFSVTYPDPPFGGISTPTTRFSGGNILMRLVRTVSGDEEIAVQIYYDRTSRSNSVFEETRDTVDLDGQHRFMAGQRHEIVWGGGYRFTADRTATPGFTLKYNPDGREDHLFSAFVQDTITLLPDCVSLTIGTKLEHNDYSGFEVQPSARLLWTPDRGNSVWASVSRAVRSPSRSDSDLRINTVTIPGPVPTVVALIGSKEFGAEDLLSFEVGYRTQPVDTFSLDIAAFYNVYDNLKTAKPGAPFREDSHMVLPWISENGAGAEGFGVEMAAEWRPVPWWEIKGAYTFLKINSDDTEEKNVITAEKGTPRHQVSVRSMFDLGNHLELDLWGRFVDRVGYYQPSSGEVLSFGSYVTLDARLCWKPHRMLEVSLVGQNLLHNRHGEYITDMSSQSFDTQRGVYGKITWRF